MLMWSHHNEFLMINGFAKKLIIIADCKSSPYDILHAKLNPLPQNQLWAYPIDWHIIGAIISLTDIDNKTLGQYNVIVMKGNPQMM